MQNVELTQAPVERNYVPIHARTIKGKVKRAKHGTAERIPVSDLTVVNFRQNVHEASHPIVHTLPENLPATHPDSVRIKDPVSFRMKPEIINAGFPDRITTLPPRYRDAAKFDIQYLDVNQGLNSSYIWDIVEDSQGYLWFATYGGGLSRYDGKSLIRYTENAGLPSNYICTIEEDYKGNIWLGTYGKGLSKFDGKSFTNYTSEEGLPSDYILCIMEDIQGNLWISTDGSGVVKFDGNKFWTYSIENGLSSNEVWDIFQDDNRNIWFGTNGGGISILDGNNWTYLTTAEGLSSDTVWDIMADKNGYIWIGTEGGGLNKFDGEKIEIYKKEHGLSSNQVRNIAEDNHGVLWLATEGGSVCSFDGEQFVHYGMEEGITSDFIRLAFHDQKGNMWFGTDGGGVNRLHPNSFRHFTTDDGMLSNYVCDIFEDSKGNLWFATDGDGACMFNGIEFMHFTEEDGLANNLVMSIIEDRRGNIWFATDLNGVSKFDGESFTNYTIENGLASNRLLKILEDRSGNLWFATKDNGVCVYDGTYYTYYNEESGLLTNTVVDIYEDNQGAMWLISEKKGASKIKDGKITHFTKENGLSSSMIQSVHEDYCGNIWFAHIGKGIDKFDGKSITNFTTADGLTSNYVWSITEDDNRRLWVCTEAGISCIDIDTASSKPFPQIYSFGKEDGLKSLDFYANSSFHDRQNRLWFGSSQALSMLDLNNFELLNSAPTIHLTNVLIDEENINFSKLSVSDSLGYTYSSVEKKENVPIGLSLNYNKNHLTFHFSGIDWNSPQKVKFSYYLYGIDPHWSAPSTEAKADYRNLAVGEHHFQVKALTASGLWSEPVMMEFRIFPPWWRTWWAVVLYSLGLIFIALGGYKFRTVKYRKHQKLLEETVQARTDELFTQKQEVERQKKVVDVAYNQLEEKNTEILDSISYAKRIQASILPSDEYFHECLPDSFILYLPKDIVAGDFYWCEEVEGRILLAAADCTGHGVPGAMISVICHSALNRALKEFYLVEPDKILNKTREILIEKFDKGQGGIQDGMDISLAIIDMKKKSLIWAGANNPLWIIRKGQDLVQEVKGDIQPIGKYPSNRPFTAHEIKFQEGDLIYLLTDGFPDQFGGAKGKKYKSINLKQFLVSIADDEMKVQPYKLKKEFYHWKAELEQIDDVCIIGVRF